MGSPVPTPLSLFTDHAWEQAFFTTYALSLTFFESQIKPSLVRNGCREIWIIADADGYERSLEERLSGGAGAEYRVVPVAMEHGIFHPKLIYLVGRDEDVLVVGSGNLTFGGYGANVEVAEVFSSKKSPQVFRDLVDCLHRLALREDFYNPDSAWLPQLTQRVEHIVAAAEPATTAGIRLWHSLEQSFADQVLAHMHAHGGACEVRVLSPFHDPDAAALISFVKSSGASSLMVGLLPGQGEITFPFQLLSRSPIKIRAAEVEDRSTLVAEDDDETEQSPRPLHAKWFEFDLRDGSRSLLTGSVNATRKSFASTNNVEIALLRVLTDGFESPLNWRVVKAPGNSVPVVREEAGLKRRLYVHARLSLDGGLTGQLIGKKELLAGKWRARLEASRGEEREFTLITSETGAFNTKQPGIADLAQRGGLQLHLTRDALQAAGWVCAETLLAAGKVRLLDLGTLQRHLDLQATLEDDLALVHYLMESAQRHLHVFDPRSVSISNSVASKKDTNDEGVVIEVSRLSSQDRSDPDCPSSDKASENDGAIDVLMIGLRRSLLRRLDATTGSRAVEAESMEDDTVASDPLIDQDQDVSRMSDALARFEQTILQVIADSKDQRVMQALMMWHDVKLAMLLERQHDPESAMLFIRHWLNVTSRRVSRPPQSQPDALDRYVCQGTAVIAARTLSDAAEADRSVLALLHEELSTFLRGDPDETWLVAALAGHADHALACFLPPGAPRLQNALLEVLVTRSFRSELQALLDWQSGASGPPTESLNLLSSNIGRTLADEMRSPESVCFVERRSNSEACPKCNMKLSFSASSDLNIHRLCFCGHCQRFIYDTRLPEFEPDAD